MTTAEKDSFADRLRQARHALGLTRRQLADLAGVDMATIRSIEYRRIGAGRYSSLQVLASLAAHDPPRARWVAEATDVPPAGRAVLELGRPAHRRPPPIHACLRLDLQGPRKQLRIGLDWEALLQLIRFAAWQELKGNAGSGVSLMIALSEPELQNQG
jgi:transcriptional regulator with XRE-family HTH domain